MWQNCKIQDVIPLANEQLSKEGRKEKQEKAFSGIRHEEHKHFVDMDLLILTLV